MSTRKRSRSSAKAAGTRFETSIAGYLAEHVDDRIERRARNGGKDRGDLASIRLSPALGGGRVAGECKNTRTTQLGPHHAEAETARGNDDAVAALLIHKRHGHGDPAEQWVTMTMRDLVAILTGQRPETP